MTVHNLSKVSVAQLITEETAEGKRARARPIYSFIEQILKERCLYKQLQESKRYSTRSTKMESYIKPVVRLYSATVYKYRDLYKNYLLKHIS